MIATPASLAAGSTCSQAVEDDLDARDVCSRDRRQRFVTGLDRHAVVTDPPIRHHLVERVEHGVVAVDRRRRAVQLDQIDRVDAEVSPRAVVPGEEVLATVVLP
jgi:hypothetical protein